MQTDPNELYTGIEWLVPGSIICGFIIIIDLRIFNKAKPLR